MKSRRALLVSSWPSPQVGAVLWLMSTAATRPEWTAALLLLSPFVLVPLGLRLVARGTTGSAVPSLNSLAAVAPLIAIAAAASFVADPGALAAMISLPWFVFTIAIAFTGTARLLSRHSLLDPGIGTDAGLIFVAVGGAWFTISRAGLNPLGFSDAIVQLTAVHFHYAGFALPIVAGFVSKYLRMSSAVSIAVIVGVPLTAVGITFGGWLEWIGATTMALAGAATALCLLRISASRTGPIRVLLGLAGVSLAGGMSLALGWSWSVRFDWTFLGLDSMAAVHGSLNALGFGVLGLIGLNMLAASEPAGTYESLSTSLHLGRPSTDALDVLARSAHGQTTTNASGLLNRPVPAGFRRKVWTQQVDADDFSAASEAIRHWNGHQAAGIKLSPTVPAIQVGETLALAIPVGPISVSATCRIVDVFDEPNRYGFAYSTLPHHPEDGEESFVVARHADGTVDVSVTAVWRPATLANHVCRPLGRFLQNRTIGRYLSGIATYQPHPTSPKAARPCN